MLRLVVVAVTLVVALLSQTEGAGLQRGKVSISRSTPAGFYCQTVYYPSSFTGSSRVHLFTSVNHGGSFSRVHDVINTWTESIGTTSSRVCMEKTGQGPHGNATIDWIALQGTHPAVQHGNAVFITWATGTQCTKITFPKQYSKGTPKVWVSARHTVLNRKQDAMALWTTALDNSSFTACMRESKLFSGAHKNLLVDWIAFDDIPSSLNITEVNTLTFPSGRAPTESDNFASCKDVNLTFPYYAPPVVMVTPDASASSFSSEKYAVSSWIEEITTNKFKVCIKELVGPAEVHQEVTVNYMVIGDIHPCLNVSCDYFAECQAFAVDDAQCVCPQSCPAYVEQICSTNGKTFDNECLMKQHVCRIKGNFSYYHHGSCQGFPNQEGRRSLDYDPAKSEFICESVNFNPFSFYPDKDVHILATVNHYNHSHSGHVLDASSTWVEDISDDNFTVCSLFAGRYERKVVNIASVDWMAYQGSPDYGVTGQERFSQWWTGTSCRRVTLPKGRISRRPTVLLTAQHSHRGLKHDATMTWTEDISTSGFFICLREMQNFDGAHEEILVNWMAFDKLHRPIFREHGNVPFTNTAPPPRRRNYAFCKKIDFTQSYRRTPTVLLTPSIVTNGQPSDGAGAWVEHLNSSGFEVCVKQVFDKGYSPLTVNYAVLADVCGKGWTYFRGFCYMTSQSCLSWGQSHRACAATGSDLTSVHSQEENVFIQQRHNGASAWVGLNDVITEGSFAWVDRSAVNFTSWAQHQPNNYNNQDCVHTLGVHYGYQWNDVECTACHNYTCKRDYNECSDGIDKCDVIATCVNTPGSYACTCPAGYSVQGFTCNDVNECGVSDRCHVNATCTNTVGSYNCACKSGFTGNGKNCTDIDECSIGTHRCHANAQCTNTIGSYICQCNNGHSGNGHACSDINECGGAHGCHANARCINTPGSYICRCNSGYHGNGKNCRYTDQTCSSIKSHRGGSSGTYTIDPDGPGGQQPFNVYCDMTDQGGVGVTVVSHDSEARTYVKDGVQSPGSYSRHVTYQGANLAQLAQLTRVSINCKQFIKWECYETMFIASRYSWWVSRDNQRMDYWGGASPGSGKCACGTSNTCDNGRPDCNCDNNDSTWRYDQGFLTDKTSLPVREMRFGDFDSSDERGYYTLGKFICYGVV